jgi:hypothetical protein
MQGSKAAASWYSASMHCTPEASSSIRRQCFVGPLGVGFVLLACCTAVAACSTTTNTKHVPDSASNGGVAGVDDAGAGGVSAGAAGGDFGGEAGASGSDVSGGESGSGGQGAQAGDNGSAGAGGSDTNSVPDLSGAQVDWIGRYPDKTTAISKPLSAVVGPGIEFPHLEDSALPGYYVAAADIDIGPADIDIHCRQALTVPHATFNGYVLSFAPSVGKELPVIKSVSVDPASSPEIAAAELTFDGTTVNVNLADLTLKTTSRLLIDVGF